MKHHIVMSLQTAVLPQSRTNFQMNSKLLNASNLLIGYRLTKTLITNILFPLSNSLNPNFLSGNKHQNMNSKLLNASNLLIGYR